MIRLAAAQKALGRRSPTAIRFFEWQFRKQLQRNFTAIRLSRSGPFPTLDPARPLVVYTNHPGWWEAVIYFHLGRLPPFRDRTGYGPINVEELQKYPFLDRLGLFGIAMESYAGAAQFLTVATSLLTQPNTMLWLSAEGKFTDVRPRPIALKPGMDHLATRILDIQFLPIAIEYAFWNERRPELLVRCGKLYSPIHGVGAPHHALLEQALTHSMDRLAEESISRDPALFTTLLEGGAGINPVYDAIRRLMT
jgi:hypothetical protein